MSKKVFTTGEVASLLGVNINTVIKWFDKGELVGFSLPKSNERRIPLAGLRAFMAKNKMPIELLMENTPMMRLNPRIPCNESAALTLINGETYGPYPAMVEDLSLGGAKVSIRNQKTISLPVDAFELGLEFDNPALRGSVFSGRLVHLHAAKGALYFGLHFNQDGKTSEKLSHYLDSL